MNKSLVLVLSALTISTTVLSAGCKTCGNNQDSRKYSNFQHRQARMHVYYSKNSNYRDRKDDTYVCTEDLEILREIHKGLESHGFDYNQNNVHISVEYGKVVFDGRVSSDHEKELLRDIALHIPHVHHVIVDVYVFDNDPMKNMRISNKRSGPRE